MMETAFSLAKPPIVKKTAPAPASAPAETGASATPAAPSTRRDKETGALGRRRARLVTGVRSPAPSKAASPASVRDPALVSIVALRDALEAWTLASEVRLMSPATIRIRQWVTEKLLWHIENEQKRDVCDRVAVERFLLYAGQAPAPGAVPRWGGGTGQPCAVNATRQVRPVSVQSYYRTLRTLFNWMVHEERIGASPLARVKPPVARADQITPFTDDNIHALLAAAKTTGTPRRDTAVMLFMLDTGLRAGEVCALKSAEIDLDARSAHVRRGKGNKGRTVFFGKRTASALRAYLRIDERDATNSVFISERGTAAGEALTVSGLSQIIRRAGKQANVTGVRCSSHTFRHTFAIAFIRAGGSEFSLMTALGHTDLAMTRRYCDMARADLRGIMRAASPVELLLKPKSAGRG